ncbi:hypothetical protein SNEBB_004757 [Seison nebaliae]|nr:hypothetical protein SNEBB_004757 [Seison nebaliae]
MTTKKKPNTTFVNETKLIEVFSKDYLAVHNQQITHMRRMLADMKSRRIDFAQDKRDNKILKELAFCEVNQIYERPPKLKRKPRKKVKTRKNKSRSRSRKGSRRRKGK